MKLFAQDKWLEGIQGPVLLMLAKSELIGSIQIQPSCGRKITT